MLYSVVDPDESVPQVSVTVLIIDTGEFIKENLDIVLYSVVDPDESVPQVSVTVLIIDTGEFIKENLDMYKFLGTVKLCILQVRRLHD